MNEAEAREIVAGPQSDRLGILPKYYEARGFLEGLEAGRKEKVGCEHLDAPYRRLLKELAAAKAEIECLRRAEKNQDKRVFEEVHDRRVWREAFEAERKRFALLSESAGKMAKALDDIEAHTVHPFSGEKWRNYLHQVAKEAATAYRKGEQKGGQA